MLYGLVFRELKGVCDVLNFLFVNLWEDGRLVFSKLVVCFCFVCYVVSEFINLC